MLPVGSEPGRYELRLLDEDRRSRLAKEATATLKEFAVRMAVNFELRSLQAGTYTLGDSPPGRGLGSAPPGWHLVSVLWCVAFRTNSGACNMRTYDG